MTTRPCLLTRQLLLLLKKHRTVRGFYIELVRAAHLLKSTISLSRTRIFAPQAYVIPCRFQFYNFWKQKKERKREKCRPPDYSHAQSFLSARVSENTHTMQESNFSLGQTPLKCSRGKPPDSHSTPLCREQHAVALSKSARKKKHTHSKQNINYLGSETNFESSPSILWIQEERWCWWGGRRSVDSRWLHPLRIHFGGCGIKIGFMHTSRQLPYPCKEHARGLQNIFLLKRAPCDDSNA